jgi:hypothetical protein
MPLQTRVTPFGDIVAVPERGLFTGNRGIIHDPSTKTLLSRRWTNKAWIICSCSYKGRRRDVMGSRSWTELFFLDEATALAAGHRPCFLCRREAALAFRASWAVGEGGSLPYAAEIDRALHLERLDGRKKRLHPLTVPVGELPDGSMVASRDAAYLVLGGALRRWSAAGYREGLRRAEDVLLITPPSTVSALATGYRPLFHPTAGTGC